MIDGATRAEWERGFGAILKKAEQVDAARMEAAKARRWDNAWLWEDPGPDPTHPVEQEVFRKLFWQCKNARGVATLLETYEYEQYKRATPNVDWEHLAALGDEAERMRREKAARPRQLSLPWFDISPSIIRGRVSRSASRVLVETL